MAVDTDRPDLDILGRSAPVRRPAALARASVVAGRAVARVDRDRDIAYTEPGRDTPERQAHRVDRVDTPGHRGHMTVADRARILVGPGMAASRQ